MRVYQTSGLLIAFLLGSILAEEQCLSYVDTMAPILRSGDIQQLQKAFKKINSGAPNSIQLPVENTVVVDKHNINMLISLSKPFISLMNATDLWPRNSRADGDVTSLNTHHGGVRFIFSCVIHQERSCLKNECRYNPSVSMGTVSGFGLGLGRTSDIHITIDNFIAADGSAIADYIKEGEEVYIISGFSKITVLECYSRQLFVKYGDDDCFDKAKFLSLSEKIEMSRGASGVMSYRERSSFFALMS